MSFVAIAALIDNPLSYPEGTRFAAILGASPSKGARSPVLWNAAFKAQGIEAQMLPMDIPAERLARLLAMLEANPDFIGGAIAMPHKESIARWLGDRVTPEVHAIGAVNCLYRDTTGRLMGTNTDGEGAVVSYEKQVGSLSGKSVLLLGPGGAGKAVAAFMAPAVKPQGRLTICSRAPMDHLRLGAAAWIDWQSVGTLLSSIDVLVNCTSIGAAAQVGQSPLSSEHLSKLPAHAVVFDIIYQPSPSALLQLAHQRGLQTLDGTVMNLEQAVLAFGYAVPQIFGDGVTRAAMEAAKKKLD